MKDELRNELEEVLMNEKIEKRFHQLLGAAKDPLYGDEYCSVLIYLTYYH